MRKRSLTKEQEAEVKELAGSGMPKAEIARKFGVSPQLISRISLYGYEVRPYRDRRKAPQEPSTWVELARLYNLKYPDDPMSAEEIKSVHDLALKKIKVHFEKQGLVESDLL
jgi:hypothetical protein